MLWSTAAFLLVVEPPGRPARPVSSPTVADLGFSATHATTWQDRSGSIRLHLWDAGAGDHPDAWSIDAGAISIVTGHLFAPITPPSAQGLVSARVVDPPAAGLRGVAAAVQFDAEGDGWVTTDPLGLRCLYVAEDDGALVIGSRAALVARHRRSQPSAPRRDPIASCWLAHTGYWVGPASGWEGVEVLGPGRSLRVRRGRISWHRHEAFAERAPDGGDRRSVREAAEVILDEVGSSLASILESEEHPPVIRLTGGKDSRLLLAAALHRGLADKFAYETVGYPGLADADVASELAEGLGLAHELRFVGLRSPTPYRRRFDRFVAATGGMVNTWGLDASNNPDRVVVTGICGEALRAYGQLPAAGSAESALAERFATDHCNRLGLVRPEVAERLQAELLAAVTNEPSPDADARLRYHAHFAHHRMRFARLGPREELAGDRRAHPLYSPVTLAAAMSIPAEDRHSEVLFAEAMRLSCPSLVEHRFAGAGWDARSRAHLDLDRVTTQSSMPPSAAPRRSGPPPSSSAPLMAALGADPAQERLDHLAERLGGAENPAWAVLDRARALEALGRMSTLTGPERLELFGAATAATWLAG